MSELKAYRVKGITLGDTHDVYLKSEADKVIAELKAQKAQAEDDCAYWKQRSENAVNARRETEEACMFLTNSERHHKYKRCITMAKLCQWKMGVFIYKKDKNEFYWRWHKRWLKIAEQFKEEK